MPKQLEDFSLHIRKAEMSVRDSYTDASLKRYQDALHEIDIAIMELVLAKVSILNFDDEDVERDKLQARRRSNFHTEERARES